MTKKRILVIEDDETVRHMLRLILERAGYEVELSEDGQTVYDARTQWPHLFLLDKQLLGNDGLDICRYIKSNPELRSIPVIVLSATPDIESIALEAGADDFMAKPLNTMELLMKVSRCLGSSDDENPVNRAQS